MSITLFWLFPKKTLLFFISNVLLESVKDPDVLAVLLTDHSPITFSLLFRKCDGARGKSLWKDNNSLCENSKYINTTKKHIISTLENLKNENITDEQSAREYLKYKIKKFSKKYI